MPALICRDGQARHRASSRTPSPLLHCPGNGLRQSLCYALAFLLLPLLTSCAERLPPAAQRVLPAELPAAQRAAHRRLPLEGAHNFRDLGGYRTADGQQLRWGLLYRADSLSELDTEDLRYLQRLQLRQAVDFRSPAERAEEPDRLPEDVQITQRPITVGPHGANLRQMFSDAEALKNFDGTHWMQEINRELVQKHTPVFRDWLHDLARSEATPQVFHCTAGKDRTGFAAAMLLTILGVPQETVMQDYLLSQVYGRQQRERMLRRVRIISLFRIDPQVLQPLMGVEASFLEAAFDEIETEYGTMDNYIENGLGVDRDTRRLLRARFLEPPS